MGLCLGLSQPIAPWVRPHLGRGEPAVLCHELALRLKKSSFFSEATPGDGEGPGSLVCCSPWGRKESDTTW